MRVFEHPNTSGGFICPICHTGDDVPVVLVGIDGTQQGRNVQAKQVHLACLELTIKTDGLNTLIYQFVRGGLNAR